MYPDGYIGRLASKQLDEFALMSSSGEKSKRYYVSKNFYHFVRPGDKRIKCAADDGSNIYALAFKNNTANTTTIVLVNDNATDKAVQLVAPLCHHNSINI